MADDHLKTFYDCLPQMPLKIPRDIAVFDFSKIELSLFQTSTLAFDAIERLLFGGLTLPFDKCLYIRDEVILYMETPHPGMHMPFPEAVPGEDLDDLRAEALTLLRSKQRHDYALYMKQPTDQVQAAKERERRMELSMLLSRALGVAMQVNFVQRWEKPGAPNKWLYSHWAVIGFDGNPAAEEKLQRDKNNCIAVAQLCNLALALTYLLATPKTRTIGEPVTVPKASNQLRRGRGLLPIPPRRTVNLCVTELRTYEPKGSTHASPVPHERRAHIRRLNNGVEVPVRRCQIKGGGLKPIVTAKSGVRDF